MLSGTGIVWALAGARKISEDCQAEECQSAGHGARLRMRLLVEFLMRYMSIIHSPPWSGLPISRWSFEIDDEIEHFQRDEADQDGTVVGDLGDPISQSRPWTVSLTGP